MKKIKIKTTVLNVELNRVDFDILLDDDIYDFLKDKVIRVCKTASKVYVCFKDNNRLIRLSRYILNLKDRGLYIRHKDNDVFNCLRGNLYTESRSNLNRFRSVNKYRGIRKHLLVSGRERYSAIVWLNGRYIQVATYNDEKTAAMKYDAATKFLEMKTHINIVNESTLLTDEEKTRLRGKSNEDC